MGVKIAHELGAEVTVLSPSLKKQDDALKLGADLFFATSDPAIFKKLLRGYFDLMINTGLGLPEKYSRLSHWWDLGNPGDAKLL
ncbi:MAG: hypothetical protein WBP64_08645 [Nitrososphaeraceae archaeon]